MVANYSSLFRRFRASLKAYRIRKPDDDTGTMIKMSVNGGLM